MEEQQIQEIKEERKKAGKLRILFRLAFICNIFFIVCLVLRYTTSDRFIPQPFVELSVILGWFFSPVINLACFGISFILVLKRGKGIFVPAWLLVVNLIFFITEIIYFFLS